MGVAALISWLVTALFGLFLLTVWLIENDVIHGDATASRLPAPMIFAHALLALAGLVCWVFHLLSGSDTAGWAAVGLLAGVAVLGLAMFTRWIPVHRAYVAAEARGGRQVETRFPAERAFPVPAVVGHGLLAVTTLTLVLLSMLGG
jgi:manganese efflux pump family protein